MVKGLSVQKQRESEIGLVRWRKRDVERNGQNKTGCTCETDRERFKKKDREVCN